MEIELLEWAGQKQVRGRCVPSHKHAHISPVAWEVEGKVLLPLGAGGSLRLIWWKINLVKVLFGLQTTSGLWADSWRVHFKTFY